MLWYICWYEKEMEGKTNALLVMTRQQNPQIIELKTVLKNV